MDIGLALPHMGTDTTASHLLEMAREAERLHYASLWAGERLLRPRRFVPFGSPSTPMPEYFAHVYDPLESLAFVAAVTQNVTLGTSVIVPFFHTAVVLARRFATLDHLSSGRVIAGLGQGWLEDEFRAVRAPFGRRGDGLEEYVQTLRACWGPDPVRSAGRWSQIDDADIGPKPVQAGGLPVLFGAGSPAAIARAARLGDGLNPLAVSWPSLNWLLRQYRMLVREAGRDPERMLIVVRANSTISTQALPETRVPLSGSLEQIQEDVHRLQELGVGHVFFDLAAHPMAERLALLAPLRSIVA